MWTARFWRDAAERAVKTFAQTAVALLGADLAGLVGVNWRAALVTALLAAGLSLLSSLGSSQVGDSSSPSLITEVSK